MISFYWWCHGQNYEVINTFVFWRTRGANFADIIKIIAIFIKIIFRDSKKVKRIRNYVSRCNLYFLSRDSYFLDLLWVRYNCAKFHHCGICVTDFREWAFFGPPLIREQPRKGPSWIALRRYVTIKTCQLNFPELLILGKYVKIRFKNWWSPCYFLSSRGQEIKILHKLNMRDCFVYILDFIFMALLAQKLI